MAIITELWNELFGIEHAIHQPIPWGIGMMAGFVGTAAVAVVLKIYRR